MMGILLVLPYHLACLEVILDGFLIYCFQQVSTKHHTNNLYTSGIILYCN